MDARCLLPCTGLQVERVTIEADGDGLELYVSSEQVESICPYCGQHSARVHSWYERRPQDVASGGRAVRLHLRVRRFFCGNPICRHRVFCERLPELVVPYARRTNRVSVLMQQLGLRLGCTASVEVLGQLAITKQPLDNRASIAEAVGGGEAHAAGVGHR